jgi:hypothetical protein
MGRMNELTVLGGTPRGLRGVPAWERGDEAGRRQRLVGIRDAGGERRRLFGVGEGPTDAIAGAKQESEDRCPSESCESGQVGQKWVSRHVLATCH